MAASLVNLTILGSTGSIGLQYARCRAPASRSLPRAGPVCPPAGGRAFRAMSTSSPDYAVLSDPQAAAELQRRLVSAALATEVLSGVDALERMAALPEVDAVMAAIVGAAGLRPTLARPAPANESCSRTRKPWSWPARYSCVSSRKMVLFYCRSIANITLYFQSLPSGFKSDLSMRSRRPRCQTSVTDGFRRTLPSGRPLSACRR